MVEVDIEGIAKRIASAEGLDGQSIEAYQSLVLRRNGSLRATLQAIEAGEMLARSKPEPPPEDPEPPPEDPEPPLVLPEGYRQITARFGGRCLRCGEAVKPGEAIGYNQRVGILCRTCLERRT